MNPDKEYLGITGLPEFTKNAALLAYGADSAPLKAGSVSFHSPDFCCTRVLNSFLREQVAVTQSISGTGALRIGGAFLGRFIPTAKVIYLPTPSWGNHTPIFRDSGLEVRQYRYFDKKTVGLDFAGLKEDIRVGSIQSRH